MRSTITSLLLLIIFVLPISSNAQAGTAFTYQGELEQSGSPAAGEYDFEFVLFDAVLGGNIMAGPDNVENVFVDGGLFSTQIDFGAGVFGTDDLWLEVRVREGEATGEYSTLLPRQRITASPVAQYADDIAVNSVTTDKIGNGSILNEDLASDSITSDKVADGSISTADIAGNAITTDKIENGTVLNEDLAADSITTDKVFDGTISNADVADGALDLATKVAGVLPEDNGGTGIDASGAADGQLLVGNGGGFTLGNITGGTGIIVTNTSGGIEITSGVQGVNTQVLGSVNIGSAGGGCPGQRTLPAGATWISSAIPVSGVSLGNVVVGSINYDLQGVMMTTYVTGNNIVKVAMFNSTGFDRCFDGGLELRALIVQ